MATQKDPKDIEFEEEEPTSNTKNVAEAEAAAAGLQEESFPSSTAPVSPRAIKHRAQRQQRPRATGEQPPSDPISSSPTTSSPQRAMKHRVQRQKRHNLAAAASPPGLPRATDTTITTPISRKDRLHHYDVEEGKSSDGYDSDDDNDGYDSIQPGAVRVSEFDEEPAGVRVLNTSHTADAEPEQLSPTSAIATPIQAELVRPDTTQEDLEALRQEVEQLRATRPHEEEEKREDVPITEGIIVEPTRICKLQQRKLLILMVVLVVGVVAGLSGALVAKSNQGNINPISFEDNLTLTPSSTSIITTSPTPIGGGISPHGSDFGTVPPYPTPPPTPTTPPPIPTSDTTEVPNSIERILKLLENEIDVSGITTNINSAEYRAVKWLAESYEENPAFWVCDLNLVQQYAIATFSFSFGEDYKANWLSSEPICNWRGLECSTCIGNETKKLTKLDIYSSEWTTPNQMLEGTLPTQIGLMTGLTWLTLEWTNWLQHIPGTLPTEIGQMTSLERLSLAGSNQITGMIPTEIGFLTNLDGLFFAENLFTGTIPTEIGLLTNFRWLNLRGNELTGTIPTEIGLLTNLITLHLGNNQLTGIIPTFLGSMTSLRVLDLNGNHNMTGDANPLFCDGLDYRSDFMDLWDQQNVTGCYYQFDVPSLVSCLCCEMCDE